MNDLALLQEVDSEYSHQVECLRFRHKKAHDVYRFIVIIVVSALLGSLYSWGLDVWAQHRADQLIEDARAALQAEMTAKEEAARMEQEAAQKSQAEILEEEANTLAKAFYGIHLFVEKYHYTEADLKTYARCVFNRDDATNNVNGVKVIISRPEQFTGYDDRNPVQTEFKDLALKFLQEWHGETSKPCDFAFQFAELTPDGIFLVKNIPAGPYERRWHA